MFIRILIWLQSLILKYLLLHCRCCNDFLCTSFNLLFEEALFSSAYDKLLKFLWHFNLGWHHSQRCCAWGARLYKTTSLEAIIVGHWDLQQHRRDILPWSSILLFSCRLLHGSLQDISNASLPEDVLRQDMLKLFKLPDMTENEAFCGTSFLYYPLQY